MTLIAFEGGEASGKSTQARLLAERLGALFTHEPGATSAGAAIRSLVLDPATSRLDHRTEALLMAADRAQHVAEVILPALAAGRTVVTDRYLYSSLAYQGYGRGIDVDAVRSLSLFADAPDADLVVLLVVPTEIRAQRLADHRDRIEADVELLERVEAGYLTLAAADVDRWAVVEGSGTIEDVAARVLRAVSEKMPA